MTAAKKRLVLIWVILMMITGICPAVNSVEDVSSRIETLVREMMKKYDIPGVNIAIVRQGKLVWSGAFGYADLESGRKMTAGTVCRAESISKSVTAWGVLNLAGQGLVDLDIPVRQYLGDLEFQDNGFPENKITIRKLLTHNAGLPLGTIGNEYPPEGFVPSLWDSLSKEVYLVSEPGSGFSYSNTGFNLLELIVEEASGRNFAEYMKKEVLNPLGMVHSGFTWSESLSRVMPSGYDLSGDAVPQYVYPEKASGGLYTTVEDVALFMAAGMIKYSGTGGNVLDCESINDLYAPEIKIPGLYGLAFDSYGLGHFVENLSQGIKAVSHGGQGHGWMTHFHFIPETGDGIVILTNSQRSWPLIARVVALWSGLCGFDSIGMEVIVSGQKILWVIIILLTVFAVYKILHTAEGIVNGKLKFINAETRPGFPALTDLSGSILLFFFILWSVVQDYFFLFSVSPVASFYLEISMLFLASALLLSFLFPKTNR